MVDSGTSRHRSLWREFAELGTDDLYALLRLRSDVFVVEQRCAYPDIDGRDPQAAHLLAWLDAGSPLSGCLRIFAPGVDGHHAKIGRVATATSARGQGLGRWMMQEALATISRRFGPVTTEIDAQVDALRFYTSLGFERASGDYDEDGIAHCLMRHSPKA